MMYAGDRLNTTRIEMIEDSSWSDKHGCMYVKENGSWRPALLGEYPELRGGVPPRPAPPAFREVLDAQPIGADQWRTIAVIAILVAMVLAFMLVLS